MKMYWIMLGSVAMAGVAGAQVRNLNAPVIRASDVDVAVTPYRASKTAQSTLPTASSQQVSALLVNGSDDCSTADAIAGTGSFSFDNTLATTGLNGQNNSPACTFSGLTAIAKDVWFLWTAPTTGVVILSDCGQTTVDTKVAVYDWTAIGSVCPANAAASTVVGCNDDISDGDLQSRTFWNATAGNQYLIQLGSFPAAAPIGGPGTFTIEYDPIPDATPCQRDDGSGDVVFRFNIAGNSEQAVFQAFGNPGDLTQVDNLFVSYGALFNLGTNQITDGMAVKVFIYEDPNDDFNPTDGVLLSSVNTTIQNHDTDLFNTVALPSPVVVSGVYFVGWSIVYPATIPANYRPFGCDVENCEALPGDQWVCWNAGAAMDFNMLGNNSQVPAVFLPVLVAGGVASSNLAWMIRPDCHPLSAGNAFCFGDGTFTDHTTACPCGNFGAPGNGCGHSFNAAGANITATGSTTLDDVVLHSSNEPVSSFTLFIQHATPADSVFHDGVICGGNPLIRLRGRAAVAGEAFFPNSNFAQDSTTTLSVRGSVTVGSGATRYYAGWYRNASTTFCPPATANVTNGWVVVW